MESRPVGVERVRDEWGLQAQRGRREPPELAA